MVDKKGMIKMRKVIIKEVQELTNQERELLLEDTMVRDDIMEYVRDSESYYIDDMLAYIQPYLSDYSIYPYSYSYMKVKDIPGFIEGVNDMNNDYNIIDDADVLDTLELAIEASDVYTGVTIGSDLYYAIQDLLESYINDITDYLIKEFVRILEYYDSFEKVESESDYVTYYLENLYDSECLIDGERVTLI